METNDSNLKPQSTGGLKLMTVFVVVLALHVVVIGSMCGYYLLKGPGTDADLLSDKMHKSLKATPDGALVSDAQTPDVNATTPSATTTPPTDATSSASAPTPAATTAPSPAPATVTDASSTAATSAGPATPAPSTATTTPTTAPTPTVATTSPAAPTPAAPEATATTTTILSTSAQPSGPIQDGSAINMSVSPAPVTPVVAETPTPQWTPPADGTPYVVKARDSLARIAHLHHTSVAKLKTANNLNSDLLRIGQKLVIPAQTPTETTAVASTNPVAPASTTSPATLASTPTTSAPDSGTVKTATPIAATDVAAPAVATAPTAALKHNVYTVVKGDTLTKIAHKFKTTPTALMTANNITDPSKLSIGKKLKIPSKEARSAKISEPTTSPQPAQVQTKASATATAQLANLTP